MSIPDLINGSFEVLGGIFTLNHCRALQCDKAVKGVSLLSVAYFSSWGLWNLYYYPSLGQWLSFFGGVFLVCTNSLYLLMLVYYRDSNKRNSNK